LTVWDDDPSVLTVFQRAKRHERQRPLKIVPDGQPVVSRHDTLNMEEAFAKVASRPPVTPFTTR